MKIVHQLGMAGDIETIRGRNGGLRLGRPAAAINLGTVVRRTEEDMDLVACFDGCRDLCDQRNMRAAGCFARSARGISGGARPVHPG